MCGCVKCEKGDNVQKRRGVLVGDKDEKKLRASERAAMVLWVCASMQLMQNDRINGCRAWIR